MLVVEDDPSLRSALEIILRDAGYHVRAEAEGTSIESIADEFRPDLAILDIRLPTGPDGYEIARTLRCVSDLPILFLSAANSLEDRLQGFRAGADDYLLKPFAMDELLARAGALLRRSGRLASGTFQIADLVIDAAAHKVIRAGHEINLTETEYRLLLTLAQHPGQVLSKVQLLEQVWGFAEYDTNLVEVHMSALRRKLEEHGSRMVHTLRRMGYVLRAR